MIFGHAELGEVLGFETGALRRYLGERDGRGERQCCGYWDN